MLKTDHFACRPHSCPPSTWTWLPKCYQWESPPQNQNWLDAEAQQAASERKAKFSILPAHSYTVIYSTASTCICTCKQIVFSILCILLN